MEPQPRLYSPSVVNMASQCASSCRAACPSWLFVAEGKTFQEVQKGVPEGFRSHQHTIKTDICQGAEGRSVVNWPEAPQDAAVMVSCNAMCEFARSLINLWAELGRKTSSASLFNPPSSGETYYHAVASTLVDLPYGFIVPGGRFREMYYWCVLNTGGMA